MTTYTRESINTFGGAQCQQVCRAVLNKCEEISPRIRKNHKGTGKDELNGNISY